MSDADFVYTRYVNGYTTSDVAGLAWGEYQEDLLEGARPWTGSELKGKAKRNSVSYARSRDSLLSRLGERGIPHHFTYLNRQGMPSGNGRKVLVIGEASSTVQGDTDAVAPIRSGEQETDDGEGEGMSWDELFRRYPHLFRNQLRKVARRW